MATAKESPSLHVKIPNPSILPPAPTSSSSTITMSQFGAASTPPTASTPTSGMHSPPLSASIHDNLDSEITLAAVPPATTPEVPLTTAPPAGANLHPQSNDAAGSTSRKGSSSPNTALSSAEIPLTTTTVLQSAGDAERVAIPTGSTSGASASAPVAAISKAEPKSPSLPVLTKGLSESSADNSDSGSSAMDEDLSQVSNVSNASSMSDESKLDDLQRQQRHQNKQMAIDHVIRKGKILKVSRRLRTRLEYAILKIRRGWSKYTLQEVESLIQPACSPIIAGRKLHGTASGHNSPRQAERKRIRKLYPSYEEVSVQHHHQRSSSDPAQVEMDESMDQVYATYRARLPSFSQYKDSELFLPAKSLMEIATSKPEPGYVSPYQRSPNIQATQYLPGDHSAHSSRHATPEPLYRDATPGREAAQSPGRWSTYSSPVTPSAATFEEEEQSEGGVPSAAQAARTILMLSSPTRPPPRTLNQNYIFDMHAGSPTTSPFGGEWTAPYSPITSSPLVQFQTNASSSPSPDRSPSHTHHSSVEAERGSSYTTTPRGSPYPGGSGSRVLKQSYSSLYGTGHEPASPSPLSTSLFPSSHESQKSHSRSSSPTLKRAARFAAAATLDSKESRTDYNSTVDQVYPEWQQARDDRQDPSMELLYPSSSSSSTSAHYQSQNYGTRTPPHQTASSPGGVYTQQQQQQQQHSHGMRTPPPSGGKELGHAHYSTSMRRRDSGMLAPPGTEMDLTKLLRAGGPSGSHHSSRHGSATASPNPGSPYHHRS
ncbi:hypothetical protein EMPS_11421 [Entomortierella parvispora]|uniref:Uncharacterized protein n=1 Tax=Entomortierella parvispora TaxID=205924 RepID=A0A9P3HLU8_9FUNG|nr:hypothetical protein EMPS_11421 [Entomortierella parvispora]